MCIDVIQHVIHPCDVKRLSLKTQEINRYLESQDSRNSTTIGVRLSQKDEQQLDCLAEITDLKVATIAYYAIRQFLDEQFGKDGAQ